MCGIVGFWYKNNSLPLEQIIPTINQMAAELHHRGPNHQGIWIDEAVGLALGHRRLSILDLSPMANQPMVSASKNFVLVYNGEIYNTAVLKTALSKAGIIPKTHSDTELLLLACEHYGVEATLQMTVGMFAFALWHKPLRLLYLARDRLGKKPLYWGIQNNILFFASQIKCLRNLPNWQISLNEAALAQYFRYNYIPEPMCIFNNLEKLMPGSIAIIDENFTVNKIRYWQLEPKSSLSNSQDLKNSSVIINTAKDLITDAVKIRMVADVPVGAFLSGGIDSTLITSYMRKFSSHPIKTYTIGFNDSSFNEAQYAKTIANFLGTDHTEHYFSEQDALTAIAKMPEFFDEPFADSSQLPTYFVSLLAKKDVTVVLTGDGGDEVFAGYNRYLRYNNIMSWCNIIPDRLKPLISNIASFLSTINWNQYGKVLPQNLHHKFTQLSKILKAKPQEFYRALLIISEPEQLLTNLDKTNSTVIDDFKDFPQLDYITKMQLWDLFGYLPGDILVKLDRASMAVSLEARSPLLDHRIAEFAFNLPMQYKINAGTTKWLLRQLLYTEVPAQLLERPKMGFGVPIGAWLRHGLRAWGDNLINVATKQKCDWLNMDFISKMWQQHLNNEHQLDHKLWGVLMLLSWLNYWRFL